MSRRESVGRQSAASQSDAGTPSVKMVSCAVLPPRLPRGMAPPTRIAAADTFGWDESLNWDHNTPIQENEPSRRKSLFRRVGLTTQRKRVDPEDDLPPFIMRQIPYDRWRKHYAKDKDGNYRGTHAPAEDCLLKPEDVQKWRLGEAVTKADKWTRGREALPVYSEAYAEGTAPEYQVDHDDASRDAPIMTPDDDRLADYFDASDAQGHPQRSMSSAPMSQQSHTTMASSGMAAPEVRRQTIADGKTAAEIIAEAEAKGKLKMTWKQKLTAGAQMAVLGS